MTPSTQNQVPWAGRSKPTRTGVTQMMYMVISSCTCRRLDRGELLGAEEELL
jgi:hypothetical protein